MNKAAIDTFLDHYQKIRKRTLKIISLIDSVNIEYRWNENQFSIGDLARHIALIETEFYLPIIRGEKTKYLGCGPEIADSVAKIQELYINAETEMKSLFLDKDDEYLESRVKIPGGEIRLSKWLRLLNEHEIHHRGQMYQLLSASGTKVPNIFGMSSEDLIHLSGN